MSAFALQQLTWKLILLVHELDVERVGDPTFWLILSIVRIHLRLHRMYLMLEKPCSEYQDL